MGKKYFQWTYHKRQSQWRITIHSRYVDSLVISTFFSLPCDIEITRVDCIFVPNRLVNDWIKKLPTNSFLWTRNDINYLYIWRTKFFTEYVSFEYILMLVS